MMQGISYKTSYTKHKIQDAQYNIEYTRDNIMQTIYALQMGVDRYCPAGHLLSPEYTKNRDVRQDGIYMIHCTKCSKQDAIESRDCRPHMHTIHGHM